jgi:DNA-binding NtrC family response regulator
LENVIERAVIFADGGELGVENLPFVAGGEEQEAGEELKDAVRLFERQHIIQSLRRHGYDKLVTAQKLGIGVSSLYRKLDEMNIPKSPNEEDA